MGEKTTTRCPAMDSPFKRQVYSLELSLNMLREKNGPSDLAYFTGEFLAHFELLLPSFYCVKPAAGTALFRKKELVQGAAAAKLEYEKFRTALAAAKDWKSYVPRLRTYAWLLTEKEQATVEDAVKKSVRERASTFSLAPIEDASAELKDASAKPAKTAAECETLAVFALTPSKPSTAASSSSAVASPLTKSENAKHDMKD